MFKKRSKSPGPSKSRVPESGAEPPVPTPSKSFTFRRTKDASQKDKNFVLAAADLLPEPRKRSDSGSRDKPLPEPSNYQILQDSVEDAQVLPNVPQGTGSKLYRMGTDLLLKANDTYTAETSYMKTAQTFGKNMVDAVSKADNGLITTVKAAASNLVSNSSVIEHAMHIADNLADLGKTLPFVAPAFVLLRIIIDIEKKARDAETKCTDLLERINFMMGNLTVLEKVSVTEAVKGVVSRIEKSLKSAVDLITAYRKQGVIARRLNLGNKDKFEANATKIKDITGDLMISLQIQQSGQLDILSRHVPTDPEDQVAQEFLIAHPDGQKNPKLVEEFAAKINCHLDDDTMQQINTDISEIIKNSQADIQVMIQTQVADAVAKGFQDMTAHMLELEKEDKLMCVQCDQEYRDSLNGKSSCTFHRGAYDSWNKSWPCCGEAHPCQRGYHRPHHHSEYPYSQFFDYARNIINYVDTVDEWAEVKDTDLETGSKQSARVCRLWKWKTGGSRIDKLMILIHIGTVWWNEPYYFHAFSHQDIQKLNLEPGTTMDKALIYHSSDNENQFSKAEWTFSTDGLIDGIRITSKAASSSECAVKFIPLDPATSDKIGEVQTISSGGFKIYKPRTLYTLPKMQRSGPTLPSKPSRSTRDDFVSTGSKSVALLQNKPLIPNEQFAREDIDYFHGSLSVFNKDKDSPIVVKSITAYYRLVGDAEYTKIEKLEMPESVFPIRVDPYDHQPISFVAMVPRSEEDTNLRIKWWNRALVARDRPIRLKFVAQEINGDKAVLVTEYVFNPFPPSQPSAEDTGFFYVDDIARCTRYSIRVKAGDYNNVVDIGSKSYSELDLHRLVHGAVTTNQSEVDLAINREEDGGVWKWNAWALIDTQCRRVYGFKVLVTFASCACLGYAPCPDYGEAVEEKDIKYATETVQMPDVHIETAQSYPQVDDLDDIVEPFEIPSSNGTLNGEAIDGKATNGGTTNTNGKINNTSDGGIEMRLESIDRNLDRLATAMETLVLLMSQKQAVQ
ncbi:hypothetical protein INT43_005088 [Umbelopsis isabellina]|uniref:Mixed lineage kinase domain-containing protein n=1 Tax=Mortierella isabellina TaxID=91625 RepID=A0A8H7PGZ7_MORIS|nr:hypothetical protein INT43_005088 [Umbelopsis isabellina]